MDRSIKQLAKKDPDIVAVFEELVTILSADPFNTTRRYDITKLTDVERGDGQWRIRSGVYRLRYDIDRNHVVLQSINHRSAAY